MNKVKHFAFVLSIMAVWAVICSVLQLHPVLCMLIGAFIGHKTAEAAYRRWPLWG